MSNENRPVEPGLSALIVEDDPNFRKSMELLVGREGFAVKAVGDLARAREALKDHPPDLVLMDLQLPDGNGLDLLQEDGLPAQPEFVVLTGHGSLDSAIEVLRAGALDYLTKPVDRARLKAVLGNVARTRELKAQVSRLHGELWDLGRFGNLVGSSRAMQQVYQLIHRVAPTGATVLITGESGTGKELVAETIHDRGPRRDALFLPVNCGAIAPSLIESELFGHERGSFTGAEQTKKGFFERAAGGTLFLDEITEMQPELQVKLLRVLETGQVMRIGGSKPMPVDVRVIAATNCDPVAAVKEGKLRDDIYYRLNVFPITLPPLRERGDDAKLLAHTFLDQFSKEMGVERGWTRAALEKVRLHTWPGNVRQLKNAVQRACILSDGEIQVNHLPDDHGKMGALTDDPRPGGKVISIPVGSSVAEAERLLVLATLDRFEGDKKRAADTLGMSLKTLYSRLKTYKAGAD